MEYTHAMGAPGESKGGLSRAYRGTTLIRNAHPPRITTGQRWVAKIYLDGSVLLGFLRGRARLFGRRRRPHCCRLL